MSERGLLVIADITGYTRFLTGSELDHAQGVLADLFAVILERLKSPLVLSNIQGDAFFAYAGDGTWASGQVLDSIEALYFGFRERLTSIVDNTTCDCRACANAGRLDLKFVVHHGEYVIEDIADRKELSGPDVILVHRLLKNDVPEQTSVASYALFTTAAVDALDLEELKVDAHPYATELDDFGRVDGAVIDVGERWCRYHAAHEIVVGGHELWMAPISRVLPFDIETVWEAWWNPDAASRWNRTIKGMSRVEGDPKRVRVGAVDHCAHGNEILVFRYVDVRPLKHATIDVALPLGGVGRWTVALSPEDSGTRVTVRFARARGPNRLATFILRAMGALFQRRKVHAQFTDELKQIENYLADRRSPETAAGGTGAALSQRDIAAAARSLAGG